MIKKLPWFEIILIAAVMSMSVYAVLSDAQNFSLRWFTRDDAYYYFKVAQNISEGHGSTFDGINKTNGYHPLWMLVCVPIFALARFDLVLPLRVLLIVMSALQVSTAILLYRLLGKVFAPAIGAIAALYWAFSFDILSNLYMQGLESGIAAFFVVLLLYKLHQFESNRRANGAMLKQLAVLGVVGALTIFSRLDLIFFVATAGLWVVFRDHPLRYFLPLDITAVIASVFLSFILRLGLPEYYDYSTVATIMVALGLLIKIPLTYFFGLYQKTALTNLRQWTTRLLLSMGIGSALVGVIMLGISITGYFPGFPRAAILLDFGFTLLFFGIPRLAYTILRLQATASKNKTNPWNELKQNWTSWLKDGAAYFGVAFGALGAYMLWSKFAFGSFSPVSGQIKRWWGSFPARVYGGATRSPFDFFGVNFEGDGLAWIPITNTVGDFVKQFSNRTVEVNLYYWYALVAVFAVFFVFLLVNKGKSRLALIHLGFIPILCGSVLQTVYYHSSGYSAFKEWYWITQRIGAILVICFALGILFTLTRRIQYRQYAAWVAVLFLGFNMAQTYWGGIKLTMQYNRWSADTPMMEIATLLEANTEPGSLIGFTGGGNVGYFIQDRAILNMDGLINSPEYFAHLQNGTAGEYLASLGLDYVLANPGILSRQPYDGQFDDYLTPTDVFYGGKQLLRYEDDK
ncbi:MAG: hypothetical protein DCC56_15125 [Anaerolineae bacterium]|nr:MAG: hypothetical protein DCC56_15125 [Anaerolineae bacterium]WKZ42456.1 MAG: hypothetical protein QY302_10160 [Anaerolineales bacterium]